MIELHRASSIPVEFHQIIKITVDIFELLDWNALLTQVESAMNSNMAVEIFEDTSYTLNISFQYYSSSTAQSLLNVLNPSSSLKTRNTRNKKYAGKNNGTVYDRKLLGAV
jgi:hypothetical protein